MAALVLAPEEVRDIGEYDAVVLSCAVYGRHWLPSVMALVGPRFQRWGGRPVWLFSSGQSVTAHSR